MKKIILLVFISLILSPSISWAEVPQDAIYAPSDASAGCIDRSKATAEFTGNDAAINNLCGLTKVEVGLGSKECAQMFIESVMNRADAIGTSVQSRLNDTPYWGAGSLRKKNTPAEFETCKAALNGALSGSNLCNYCTDNASAGLARRRKAAGNPGVDCEYAKGQYEFFYINKHGSGGGGVPAHGVWADKARAAAPSTACTSSYVDGGSPEGTGNPPTSEQPGQTQPDSPYTQNKPPVPFRTMSNAIKAIWVAGFQFMTNQLNTTMMQQAKIIGSFFDAKHQLETQRLIQQRYAEAHKDYHPSEQVCTIGTAVRDLANTSQRARLTKAAINNAILDRALATGDVKTMDVVSDQRTRMKAYQEKFCSQTDNTGDNENLCQGESKPEQINADINFTQTIDSPLTLEINLLDTETKPDEETIFSFLDYIFMHNRFPWVSKSDAGSGRFIRPYQEMRSIIAMRSVAQNSFAEIIAQKTQGPDGKEENAAPFIMAVLKDMGVEDDDVIETLGENPSYYAQMEVLTKKIYQHPEFISNLYDKPANVKRMIAAMTAIKTMQNRDIHQALMRREMLMSMLLEINLRKEQQDLINREINKLLSTPPQTSATDDDDNNNE